MAGVVVAGVSFACVVVAGVSVAGVVVAGVSVAGVGCACHTIILRGVSACIPLVAYLLRPCNTNYALDRYFLLRMVKA